jgi:phosphomannomutase/phosphoglucomutase
MAHGFFNSEQYFTEPLVDPTGFREYDARWVISPIPGVDAEVQINYVGLTSLGRALGEFLALPENGSHRRILVGHDFREYGENAKNALVLGLLSAGMDVDDIGLAVTPMVYMLQYHFSIPACAMVTASHNPNGWTGVKMGHGYSQTFGPDRMGAFRDFYLQHQPESNAAIPPGRYCRREGGRGVYVQDLIANWSPHFLDLPRMKVAVETGNGTAAIVLPSVLAGLGFEVVADTLDLDWTFPRFNPNPESLPFLNSVRALVKRTSAEVGVCIDGDGDRLGVIDDLGEIVFSDRVGLLMARRVEAERGPGVIVVDVKSTSLFERELRSRIVWEKTGHSYIKAAVAREGAIAGFERSGHFFLTAPFGRGYDDALASMLMLLLVLCEEKAKGRSLSRLVAELPRSFQSPNRQPTVPDERKYQIVEAVTKRVLSEVQQTGSFSGVGVQKVVTINGVRLQFEDGSWMLIRASSNTPNLVVVAESFDSDGARLRALDADARLLLAEFPEVGDFGPLWDSEE